MRHHFGDFLDRDGDYWTVVPNKERYCSRLVDATDESKAITLFGADDDLGALLDLPGLEELTLHEPRTEHLAFLSRLTGVRRLRVSHVRPSDLHFLEPLVNLEQLVLEYVSGFDSLTPLRSLSNLRALHLENLRRVNDFSGLAGITSLRFLSIYGTLDWKQPITDFEFLRRLPELEVLAMWQVINKSSFPATLPILSLRNLKRLKMAWNVLSAEECALLEVAWKVWRARTGGPTRSSLEQSVTSGSSSQERAPEARNVRARPPRGDAPNSRRNTINSRRKRPA